MAQPAAILRETGFLFLGEISKKQNKEEKNK